MFYRGWRIFSQTLTRAALIAVTAVSGCSQENYGRMSEATPVQDV